MWPGRAVGSLDTLERRYLVFFPLQHIIAAEAQRGGEPQLLKEPFEIRVPSWAQIGPGNAAGSLGASARRRNILAQLGLQNAAASRVEQRCAAKAIRMAQRATSQACSFSLPTMLRACLFSSSPMATKRVHLQGHCACQHALSHGLSRDCWRNSPRAKYSEVICTQYGPWVIQSLCEHPHWQ